MSVLNQILQLLLYAALGTSLLLFWLRFLMQLAQADFYNPVAQSIVRVTDPVLRPLRNALPRSRQIDFASLLAIILIALVGETLLSLVTRGVTLPPALLLFTTFFGLLWNMSTFFLWLLVISAILSWVSPGDNPVTGMIRQLAEPVLIPFRRIVPPMGGMDWSAFVAILLIQILQMLLAGLASGLRHYFV